MAFYKDYSLILGCLHFFVPISAIATILSAVAGWRLSRASRPKPLSQSELFLLRSLRLNLYEPLITSSYVLWVVFVINPPLRLSRIDGDVSVYIYKLFLLLCPMLLLLLPLRLIRSAEPHLRSYSSKLLGLSVATDTADPCNSSFFCTTDCDRCRRAVLFHSQGCSMA